VLAGGLRLIFACYHPQAISSIILSRSCSNMLSNGHTLHEAALHLANESHSHKLHAYSNKMGSLVQGNIVSWQKIKYFVSSRIVVLAELMQTGKLLPV
jgi:hypothetical protein